MTGRHTPSPPTPKEAVMAHHPRTVARARRAAAVEKYWPLIAYGLVAVTTGAYVVATLVRTV